MMITVQEPSVYRCIFHPAKLSNYIEFLKNSESLCLFSNASMYFAAFEREVRYGTMTD